MDHVSHYTRSMSSEEREIPQRELRNDPASDAARIVHGAPLDRGFADDLDSFLGTTIQDL